MKATLLAAVAALALGVGSAWAGESRHEPFGHATNGVVGTVVSAATDVGSEHYPAYARGNSLRLNQVAVLPTSGRNGIVQTANSLPSAPTIGGNMGRHITEAFDPAESAKDYSRR